MIEITTSTTDLGVSITTFRSVVSSKGPLLDYLSVLHQTTLLLSLELSGSLYSSSSILVSLSLVKTTAEEATVYPN
jgi:hypothetical protein